MLVGGPGKQPGSARTGAVLPDRFNGRGVNTRVANESQVVIGRKHQHGVAVRPHRGAGSALQRNLERIRIVRAGKSGSLEEAPGASIDEVVFPEIPPLICAEISVK